MWVETEPAREAQCGAGRCEISLHSWGFGLVRVFEHTYDRGVSQGPISTSPVSSPRPSLDDDAARVMDAELVEVERLRAAVQACRLRQAVACQQRFAACGARELAVVHLALSWQLSEARVGVLLHQGRYLLTVLPGVLAALEDGVVGPEMVEVLIEVCDVLEPDVAVAVADQVLAAVAAGRCPDASAVRARARRASVRLAPGSARQRAQRANADRDVRWWAGPDGTGTVELTGPAAKVRAALGVIRDRATLLRHTDAAAGVSVRTAAQSRFDAGLELLLGGGTNHSLDSGGAARGGSTGSGLPGVLVHVPLAVALGLSEQPAQLQGYGPLTAPAAREVIEDGAQLWPVWVHPASGEPLGVADRPVQPGRDPAAIRAALLAMRTQADQLARAGALPHQPRHPHDHQGWQPPAPAGGAEHPAGTAGPYRVPARMRRYLQVRSPQCERLQRPGRALRPRPRPALAGRTHLPVQPRRAVPPPPPLQTSRLGQTAPHRRRGALDQPDRSHLPAPPRPPTADPGHRHAAGAARAVPHRPGNRQRRPPAPPRRRALPRHLPRPSTRGPRLLARTPRPARPRHHQLAATRRTRLARRPAPQATPPPATPGPAGQLTAARARRRGGSGHQRRTTSASTSPTPRVSPWPSTAGLSPASSQPPSAGASARFTTSNAGRARKRPTTTSPTRTRARRRTSRQSPGRRVGSIEGPSTRTTPNGLRTRPPKGWGRLGRG